MSNTYRRASARITPSIVLAMRTGRIAGMPLRGIAIALDISKSTVQRLTVGFEPWSADKHKKLEEARREFWHDVGVYRNSTWPFALDDAMKLFDKPKAVAEEGANNV